LHSRVSYFIIDTCAVPGAGTAMEWGAHPHFFIEVE
jgi:hypothetical protein